MDWLISANGRIYNHWDSFKERGYIDWRQTANYEVGDIVYIYSTRPISRVEFKCIVEKKNMKFEEITDDKEFWIDKDEYYKSTKKLYSRLRLLEFVDNDSLKLDKLKINGLKAAPQGPMRLKEEILEYIQSFFYDKEGEYLNQNPYEESIYEGAVVNVKVNKYERSSLARQKCIEYHGDSCLVCGFNFEDIYGDIGKGFIHVHHIIPLSEISEEYKIDYKKDLIPVCPNCHAMLHRNENGEALKVEEVREIVNVKGDMNEK